MVYLRSDKYFFLILFIGNDLQMNVIFKFLRQTATFIVNYIVDTDVQ